MSRYWIRWTQYWFEPASPVPLGICRLLFFGCLFVYYLPQSFVPWMLVSPVFWDPAWLFDGALRLPGLRLTPPVLDPLMVQWLEQLWKLALLFSCLGLATRVATMLSFGLGIYLVGLTANFGHPGHQYQLPVLVMGILAAARAGDAVSIDRWLAKKRSIRIQRAGPHGEYTWPIRAVWLAMSLVFLAAAVAKLRHSGISWVTGDTLANYLILNNYPANTSQDPLTNWGLWLAQFPLLCRMLAGSVLMAELLFSVALISRRVRTFLVPVSFMMMIGWRLFLGPPFELFMLCYVFWVPWANFIAMIRRPVRPPGGSPDRSGDLARA